MAKKKKAKRAKATAKASTRKRDSVLLNFKVDPEAKAKAAVLADRYAGGNLSRWVRYAIANFKPSAADLKAMAVKAA